MEFNWLRLHVSNVCNFSCPHCHVYVYDEHSSKTASEKKMSSETFEKSVSSFTKVLAKNQSLKTRVSCYGGEPFVNRETMIKGISKLGKEQNGIELDWVINTNGSLIEDSDFEILKANDVEVHLSIDGKEGVHDLSRKTLGGKGTYGKVLKTLEKLRTSGVRTQINSHVMPTNFSHLNELIDLASEYKIKKIYLDLSYTPQGLEPDHFYSRYREAYYYGIKRGISILGSWSEPVRNSLREDGRRPLLKRHFGVEVNVDGTYFFPTRIETRAFRRHIDDLELNLEEEISTVRQLSLGEFENSCDHCSIKDQCFGVAKEHVRYHLGADAKTDTYCDFFESWISDLEAPVKTFMYGPFFFSSSEVNLEKEHPLVKGALRSV